MQPFGQQRQTFADGRGQAVGIHGRVHVVADPVKQLVRQRLAQPDQRVAQRRRAESQLRRGARYRPQPIHRFEHQQQIEIEAFQIQMHDIHYLLMKMQFIQYLRRDMLASTAINTLRICHDH